MFTIVLIMSAASEATEGKASKILEKTHTFINKYYIQTKNNQSRYG
jgi:hypothetical protein